MSYPLISNIQRFSVDDGPGIRTTVFFKGCNLKCAWCHNPECISGKFSIQLVINTCRMCGKCLSRCENGAHVFNPEENIHDIDREKCAGCGRCAYYCPAAAVTLIGREYEPEALLKEILKDKKYYDSSEGGVTFSGGEPMLQAEYLTEILRLSKEAGLNTAVDTAGCVPWESFEKVMPYTDVFLYDIKMWNDEKHMAATGVSNKKILENLRKLTSAGANVIIRTPVIKEWNGNLEEFEAISGFLAGLEKPVKLIQLLPYHAYGAGKYEALGLDSRIMDHTPPTGEFMENALQFYLDKGLPAEIS